MSIAKILGCVAITSSLALSLACSPPEQAKTVTNTDSTTNANGSTSESKSTDSQSTSADGTKNVNHTEETKSTPPTK